MTPAKLVKQTLQVHVVFRAMLILIILALAVALAYLAGRKFVGG